MVLSVCMKYVWYSLLGIVLLAVFAGIYHFTFTSDVTHVEQHDESVVSYDELPMNDTQDLIVIAAPSVHNDY